MSGDTAALIRQVSEDTVKVEKLAAATRKFAFKAQKSLEEMAATLIDAQAQTIAAQREQIELLKRIHELERDR